MSQQSLPHEFIFCQFLCQMKPLPRSRPRVPRSQMKIDLPTSIIPVDPRETLLDQAQKAMDMVTQREIFEGTFTNTMRFPNEGFPRGGPLAESIFYVEFPNTFFKSE